MYGVCILFCFTSNDNILIINLEGLNHYYILNNLLGPALHNTTTGVGSELYSFRYQSNYI